LTESKPLDYNVLIENFEGIDLELINHENEIWLTAETVGIGLEYSEPRKSVMNLYSSHRDEIEEFASVIDLMTEAGMRKTTIFSEYGVYLLIIFSNQPKAKEFRRWVIEVIKNIRKKGYHIEPSMSKFNEMDPIDLIIKQAELIREALVNIKDQKEKIHFLESKVSYVDTELKTFEQRYEDEKLITPQTRKKIMDFVHNAVSKAGGHHNTYYSKIWQRFGISNTTEITEKLGQEIVAWLNKNRYSFTYGSKFKNLALN